MIKSVAVIAVASGSEDVDVIVTASFLKRLGMEVAVASAEGWSAITLKHGLIIKPTCSLDRALGDKKPRPFDLLLLPGGTISSVDVFEQHSKLCFTLRSIARNRDFGLWKKSTDGGATPYVIAVGKSASILHKWQISTMHKRGFLADRASHIKTWMIGRCSGSRIIHAPFCQKNGLRIVLASSPPTDDPLQTVSICVKLARDIVKSNLLKKELDSYGNYQHCLYQKRRRQERKNTNEGIRWLLTFVRDHHKVPPFLRKYCLAPLCSYVLGEQKKHLKPQKRPETDPTDAISRVDDMKASEVEISDDNWQLFKRSTVHLVHEAWEYFQKVFRIQKRSISECKGAILVASRVDEQLLSMLIHELRVRYKVDVQIVVCDRAVLRTTDAFVVTHGFLQIRSDATIEKVDQKFDVIIAIDSEIDAHERGVCYRKSSFDWEDFQRMRQDGGPIYASCVTARFDKNGDGGKATMQLMKQHLTNQWVREKSVGVKKRKRATQDIAVFGSWQKRVKVEGGIVAVTAPHDLVFRTFIPFHDQSDIHTTISSNAPSRAIDFAKSVSDYLCRVAATKGYENENISAESRCNVQ